MLTLSYVNLSSETRPDISHGHKSFPTSTTGMETKAVALQVGPGTGECCMIAGGQDINPLKFTKLHNKTISYHFYESKTQAQPLPDVSP